MLAVLIYRTKLVHAAEGGIGSRGYKPLADAEGIDRCAVCKKLAYKIFVKRIGSAYLTIGISRLVKHLSCFAGKIRYIAAVYTDTNRTESRRNNDLVKCLDSVGNTRFERIVGIDKQGAALRILPCVRLEGIKLAVEHLYPRMCHGTQRRHAIYFIAYRARRTAAAGDISRPRTKHRRIGTLSAS